MKKNGLALDLNSLQKLNTCYNALPATLRNFPFHIVAHAKLSHDDFLIAYISVKEIRS